MFGYGMVVLWGKSWLWDIRYCWYHYPHHAVEADVWWYYMIELTFYWSLTFSQFYDVPAAVVVSDALLAPATQAAE